MFGKKVARLHLWYMKLSLGNKVITGSFLVWLIQAIPKWGFVFLGDGEMAASMMTLLVTPRSEL